MAEDCMGPLSREEQAVLQAGKDAALAGKKAWDNPHQTMGWRRRLWEQGFTSVWKTS